MADQYLNNVVFHTHFEADPNGPAGCPFVKYTGDVIDANMTGMDPLSQYVSVLLKLDGPDNSTTITDETLRRWEVMGSAKLVAGAGRNGKSALYLPGGGAAIRTTDVYQAGGNLGGTDFTVEAWVKLTALPTADTWPTNYTAHMGIVCGGIPGSASGWNMLLGASLVGWSNNDAFTATGTHNITTNVWYHVAVSRQSGTLRSFVNGVKVAEVANITSYYSYNNAATRTWVGCETGEGAWFQGYIDQVRITSGVARYTANFDVNASDVQTFMPVKPISINEKQDAMPRLNPSLYPVMGMASTSSSKYRGKSIFMNRNCSTANIVDASSRPIALWSSDFTFSAWVNLPDISNGGNWYWLLDEYNGTTYYSSGNWLRLGILNGTFACINNDTQVVSSSTAIQAGVWTHLAFTRKGGVNRIFVNGALTGSGGSNPNYSAAVDRPVLFNAADSYNISAFYGYVSDFLFEIGYARWDASFVPGQIDALSTPVVDQKGKVIIPYGTVDGMFTSGVKRFGNSCAYFNGTNYLTVPHSNDFNFGSGDYTIEFWMMHNNNSTAKGIMHRSFNTTPLQGWQIQIRANNTIGWEHNNGTSGDLFMSGQTALKSNVWYHVAVTRESNVYRLYVNGYCEAEFTDVGAMQEFVASTGSDMWASSFCIGSDRTAGANFVGWIDEVRITKGVARYTLPTIDQTLGDPYFKAESVFLPMNTGATVDPYSEYVTFQIKPGTGAGSSITESTGKTMTQTGNVAVTAANTKWGTSSLGFPGVNSDLSTPSSSDFDMTSGDWTWEMWFYEDPGSSGGLLCRRSTGVVGWALTTSGIRGVVNGTGFEGQMPWARPSFNTWHHIAWQKKGTTLETYIDGQLVTQRLNVTSISDEAVALRLGACNAYYESCFRGYIEDVRFTKGVARYNNNFAVPTSTYDYADASQGVTVLSMHMEGSQNNGDPYRDNVQVNLRGDTLTDDCGNAVIVTGSVTVDTAQTRNGSATIRVSPAQDLYYNMLEVTHTKAMDLNGDFTIEMWFKALTIGQSADMLFFRGNATGTLYAVASYGSGPTSQMISVGLWGGSTIIAASTKSKIALNAWNHIALCRQGSTMTLYLNGKNAGTGTYAGTLSPAVGTTWQIGGGAGYVGRSINGWIDDFRYTNGVCRYTSEFYSVDGVPVTGDEIVVDESDAYLANTVLAVKNERLNNADPYSANVTFQMRMDGSEGSQTFIEDTGKVITVTGNVNHNTGIIRPGSTSSAYFDGSADRISSASYADVSIGAAEDFTLETWFYTTTGGHGAAWWSRVVMLGSDAVNGMISIVCVNFDNPMRLRVEGYNGGYFSLIGEPSTTISNSTWHHVALTKKAGLYTLWVDGAIYAQGFNSAYAITATTVFVGGSSSGAHDFNGYIDDVRLTKGVCRYTQPDFTPQQMYRIMSFEHTGRDVIPYGDAKISTANKKYGTGSVYFNGTGDYIGIPYSTDFEVGSGDFTIEFWANVDDFSTGRAVFAFQTEFHLGAFFSTTGRLNVFMSSNGTDWSSFVSGNTGTYNGQTNTTVLAGTWNHYAIVRKGTSVAVFLNGQVDTIIPVGTTAVVSRAETSLNLGRWGSDAYYMKGYIDDFRFTKGVARYAINTIPSVSGIPASATQFYDDCGNTIQNYGVSYVGTNPKFGTKSAYFSGGNSYLKFTSNLTNFAFGLQDYSISMWIYPETVGGTNRCLIDTRGMTGDTGLALYIYATGSVLRVWTNNTGYAGTTPIVANTWTHVAMTRHNGKIQLFVNGVCEAVTETSINHVCPSQVYIGRQVDDISASFIGYMEDVRVTKGGVPSYIMNIQAPTSLPSVSSEGIMEMTKGDVITGVGPTISGTQKKYGNSSLKFSRNVNKLALTARNQFAYLGDLTIDFWIMPTQLVASGMVMFDSRTTTTTTTTILSINQTGTINFAYNGTRYTSTGTLSIGTWTHVALVRKGFNWTWYFNGVASGTFTLSTRGWSSLHQDGFTLGTAYDGTGQFYGYIDDFRITNAARWTANFTPPTTEGLTTARAAFVPDNAAFPHTSTFVTGNVYDENGNAAVRRVMSFERSSGKLIGDTYSNADGSYSVQSPASPVFVVAFDDEEGIPRNAVVEDRIIPA